ITSLGISSQVGLRTLTFTVVLGTSRVFQKLQSKEKKVSPISQSTVSSSGAMESLANISFYAISELLRKTLASPVLIPDISASPKTC
ncbi:hypothetical protein FRX31_029933, partial [Thalictrum thalictroides]